jgi:hypothetical protein
MYYNKSVIESQPGKHDAKYGTDGRGMRICLVEIIFFGDTEIVEVDQAFQVGHPAIPAPFCSPILGTGIVKAVSPGVLCYRIFCRLFFFALIFSVFPFAFRT